MNVQTLSNRPILRSAAPAPNPAPTPPPQEPHDHVSWSKVAVLGGTTLAGAGAGIYAGLNKGVISELIGVALIPGAAIGGAVFGGVVGEKLHPKFLGEYPAIGGAVYGGLAGGAIGITQSFLAGSRTGALLATGMGVAGAVAGLAGFVALSQHK